MTPHIITAHGKRIDLMMSAPEVVEHFNNPNTNTGCLFEQINVSRMYDFALAKAQDYVMLDIGANIGLVSIYASDACKRIVALEPTPAQSTVLGHLTWPFKNIERMECALSGHNGSVEFFFNDVNTCASSMSNKYGKPTIVKSITLKQLIQDKELWRVDFCKIDIEGTETDALTPEMVGECKDIIKSYYIETHNCPNSTWEWKMGKLTETLAHAGYTYMRVRGDAIYAAKPPPKK